MKRISVVFSIVLYLSLFLGSSPGAATSQSGTAENYIVLFKTSSLPRDTAQLITNAGGELVYGYNKIGVAIARSSNVAFRDNLLVDSRVEGASLTSGFGVQLNDEFELVEATNVAQAAAAGSWGDPMSNRQWDMVQIKVPEAHAVNSGSPTVVVGDIDTGLDWSHPDLAANVDFSRSVSCESGVPNQDPAAWMDYNGHGTHTAGTIAAAANGIGIIGIAPDVRIAGIKAGRDDG